jgi:AcrR family transcriptional regulator
MARTANEARPGELLDAIAEYLVGRGVADVPLRELAASVGSSPRVLLYYFGSKEAMLAAALSRLRDRQRVLLAQLRPALGLDSGALCRAVWRHLSAPESEPLFRLMVQAYSTGLQSPGRHEQFLRDTIEDWLEFLAAPRLARGQPVAAARVFATVVLAGFRGFLLDFFASRDRSRIDAAVELWVKALNDVPTKRKPK